MKHLRVLSLVGILAIAVACDKPAEPPRAAAIQNTSIQLNWLHDPTFVAEYMLAEGSDPHVRIIEGGPTTEALAELSGGRADFAIAGADIFLKQLAAEGAPAGQSRLVCVFIDFQRNPVGWVLHPDAAQRLGLEASTAAAPDLLNRWVAEKINSRALRVGDKRGTETTSIWLQWSKAMGIDPAITVEPVGFDPGVVLDAPNLLYPVYLNEEPFKLREKIGKPPIVIDPATAGVALYGNVLVARRALLSDKPGLVDLVQRELRNAWTKAKQDPQSAGLLVKKYYTGVSDVTLEAQVARTLEFAHYQGAVPGSMDLNPEGRWASTYRAVRESGIVQGELTPEQLTGAMYRPK